MTTAVTSHASALAAILGEPHVVSQPEALAAWAVGGKVPTYAAHPPTEECVAAALKFAAEHDLAVIPWGSGTKLTQGNPPRRYDLALSLKGLTRVRHYEPADLTISVEAGMKLGDLQDFLGRDGLWLPLDPRGGASATVGGILASNSAGPLRLRYGSARDMVLGIKAATTDGKLIKSGGRVVKNVAGYDMCKLLVGSYGTLGLIVEASLKLFPRPASRATWVLEPGTLGRARDLRGQILNSPLELLRMVLLDSGAVGLLHPGTRSEKEPEPELWIEFGGSPGILERHARDLRELGRSMGVPSRRVSEQEVEPGWDRFTNLERLPGDAAAEAMVLKAALPIAGSEQFLSLAQQGAEGEEVRMAGIAQPGAGIVHLAVWGDKLAEVAERLVTNTRKAAESLGGALVVEQYRSSGELDVWGAPGDLLEALRGLKAAWDPRGVLSPGRFVGGI